jgi:high-affinity iron transporter
MRMIFNTIVPMNRKFALTLFLATALGFTAWSLFKNTPAVAAEDSAEHSPRLLVHLLDYLAVDYGGAVQNGKVLSASEYKEQVEFAKTIVELSHILPEVKASPEIQTAAGDLNRLIQSKADPEKVASLARKIQALVLQVTQLPMAPSQWPNLLSGKQIFQNTCAKCHGTIGKGDGPSAASLDPKPANFLDPQKMQEVTPFHAFNTIRLGVPGTGMTAFPAYSDQDTWNMAFYISSLRYENGAAPADPGLFFARAKSELKLSPEKLLATLASQPDIEIQKSLTGTPAEKSAKLYALRMKSGGENAQASLDLARLNLEEALADYSGSHFESASRKALRAYVEGVEPVEPRLKANDPQAVADLEQLMGLVRGAINNRKPLPEVTLAVEKAQGALQAAGNILRQQAPSPTLTFTLAFGILMREGFEAVLLIVALLGVIRASGAKKARRWVHGGWLLAVAFGFVAWFFSGQLMNLSGLGRELMEGITGALTVVVLLYLGFWLHSRTEIHRWKHFIEVKVKSALEERNLLQLAFISFLAAFREAIETVLFLRAIWLEGGSETKTALSLGVFAAFVVILLLGWLLLTFSAKIPIKTLFNVSSFIMVSLAVILTGKAVHSFQEVDLVSITLSPLNLRWDWLGLYPTWEPLLFQILVLVVSVCLWIYGKRPPAKK